MSQLHTSNQSGPTINLTLPSHATISQQLPAIAMCINIHLGPLSWLIMTAVKRRQLNSCAIMSASTAARALPLCAWAAHSRFHFIARAVWHPLPLTLDGRRTETAKLGMS